MTTDETWQPPDADLDSTRPLYQQFSDIIRSALALGGLAPGQRLPSVRELAAHFRVNPNTVMRAYQDLEREGFIVTFRGHGTFVATNVALIDQSRRMLAKAAYAQMVRVAEAMGMTADELWLLAKSAGRDDDGDTNGSQGN